MPGETVAQHNPVVGANRLRSLAKQKVRGVHQSKRGASLMICIPEQAKTNIRRLAEDGAQGDARI
jgi:hypothetical protein